MSGHTHRVPSKLYIRNMPPKKSELSSQFIGSKRDSSELEKCDGDEEDFDLDSIAPSVGAARSEGRVGNKGTDNLVIYVVVNKRGMLLFEVILLCDFEWFKL